MTYGKCFEMNSSVYISLTVIVLTMALPCSAIAPLSPDIEVLLLMKKVEKFRNITELASHNYKATLKALNVARQWQLSTEVMAVKATSDMQEVMAKTTAEAVKKAEKDTSKCWNKLVLARIALEDAEEKLEAARFARKTLALVNAKNRKNSKYSKSNGSATVARVTTIVAVLIVVTLRRFQ